MFYLLYLTAILLGATSQTLYPLCISYANDYLSPEELVKASGGLVLTYGLGAAIGPTIAAYLMDSIAPNGLFYFIAAVVGVFILIIVYRIPKRAAPEEKEIFIPMPDALSSPGGLDIDPRYDPELDLSIDPESDLSIDPDESVETEVDLEPASAHSH